MGNWWSWHEGREVDRGCRQWGQTPLPLSPASPFLASPGLAQVCWQASWLLGILLRSLHPASWLPCQRGLLPQPSLGHALSSQD